MKNRKPKMLKKISQVKVLKKDKSVCVLPAKIESLLLPILNDFSEIDMSQCDNLKELPSFYFFKNKMLKKITLPSKSSITIGKKAFQFSYIEHIENCNNISIIKEYAFAECTYLSKFDFSNIASIGEYAFCNTNLMGDVVLPKICFHIGENAFENTQISNVEAKGFMQKLYKTFENQNSIENIKIEDIGLAENLISNNSNLKTLIFGNIDHFIQTNAINAPNLSLCLNQKTRTEIHAPSVAMKKLDLYTKNANIYLKNADISELTLHSEDQILKFALNKNNKVSIWDENIYICLDKTMNIYSKKYGKHSINIVGKDNFVPSNYEEEKLFFEWYQALEHINKKSLKKYYMPDEFIIKNGNLKNLENYVKNYRQYNILKNMYNKNIFQFCDILGLFEFPNGVEDKKQDVIYEKLRAKVFEGLKTLSCYSDDIFEKNVDLSKRQFNPRRTIFFLENIENVIKKSPDVIKNFVFDTINSFDEIEQFHKNKSGKITKMTLEDFYNIKFALSKQGDAISNLLYPYLATNTFASDTIKSAKDLCKKADILQKSLEVDGKDSVTFLKDEQNYDYRFEFLKHNDIRQLILGYECDSCAKPSKKAAGYGILNASMTNEDFCTFAIFDKYNNIIGKATLRVVDDGTQDCYGVINSLELKKQIRDQKYKTLYDTLDENISKQIMDTVERAVKCFCKKYQEVYKKSINNVAMGLDTNDLADEYIKRYPNSDEKILKMPNILYYKRGNDANKQVLIYSCSSQSRFKENEHEF